MNTSTSLKDTLEAMFAAKLAFGALKTKTPKTHDAFKALLETQVAAIFEGLEEDLSERMDVNVAWKMAEGGTQAIAEAAAKSSKEQQSYLASRASNLTGALEILMAMLTIEAEGVKPRWLDGGLGLSWWIAGRQSEAKDMAMVALIQEKEITLDEVKHVFFSMRHPLSYRQAKRDGMKNWNPDELPEVWKKAFA